MPDAPAPARPEPHNTETALRDAGLKVTGTRVAVLDALRGMPHAPAEQVLERVRPALPGTSIQSVYNALGDFTAAGLVRRIEPAGQPGRFELRVDDNHHHLVCTACGRVEDVDCVVGHAPCLVPSDTSGFSIVSAEVTFWGLCAPCNAAARANAPEPLNSSQEGSE